LCSEKNAKISIVKTTHLVVEKMVGCKNVENKNVESKNIEKRM
jgi:hypothetical protein